MVDKPTAAKPFPLRDKTMQRIHKKQAMLQTIENPLYMTAKENKIFVQESRGNKQLAIGDGLCHK